MNGIVWNRIGFDMWTEYKCQTELFEKELIICIKMDLALNNPQMLICYIIQTTKCNCYNQTFTSDVVYLDVNMEMTWLPLVVQ